MLTSVKAAVRGYTHLNHHGWGPRTHAETQRANDMRSAQHAEQLDKV